MNRFEYSLVYSRGQDDLSGLVILLVLLFYFCSNVFSF